MSRDPNNRHTGLILLSSAPSVAITVHVLAVCRVVSLAFDPVLLIPSDLVKH